MAASASDDTPLDPRLVWIERQIESSFRPKPDKLKKLFQSRETLRPLLEFMENAEVPRIFVSLSPSGDDFSVSILPPSVLRRKTVYFVKRHPTHITKENLMDMIVFGEFSTAPLEQLFSISRDVYLPLLSDEEHTRKWPEAVVRDVQDRFNQFLASVHVTVGQLKGNTILPVPVSDAPGKDISHDKDRVHALESAVVMWTNQIKTVLRADPEQVLKRGDNPGPIAELEYWQDRSTNLNSIYQQLSSERVKKVMKVLDVTKSTYFSAFQRLIRDVSQACEEANDTVKFLLPLRKWFLRLQRELVYTNLKDRFRPIVYLILQVWKNSKHYNTAARFVVLMRMICNDIVAQTRRYVNSETILRLEPQEAIEKLETAKKVCAHFKNCYFAFQERCARECPQNPWKFQKSVLFTRLDGFLERIGDILDLVQTSLQFSKLERIEIGGFKGKSLTASVQQIHQDFVQAFQTFEDVSYDILCTEAKQFDEDYYKFRHYERELEKRIGSIIVQGFDDCATVSSSFKLFQTFEGMTERETIQTELEKKYLEIVRSYGEDIRAVSDLFSTQKNDPPLFNNMPPIAGALSWCRGLMARISEPMARVEALHKVVLETQEAREALNAHEQLVQSIRTFELEKLESWGRDLDATSQAKLRQPLLRRDHDTQLLYVNFDPALERLLREVKYFLLLKLDVPESAMNVYEKAETFRTQTGKLEVIVKKYNWVLSSMIDVEMPLFRQQLKNIDALLQKGLDVLNWKSHGIGEFITEGTDCVKEVSNMLMTTKDNVKGIEKILNDWAQKTFLERKEQKTFSPDDFRAKQNALVAMHKAEIAESGHEIHRLLQNSREVLKVSKGSQAWKAYVHHVNRIVVAGVCKTVINSLHALEEVVDHTALVVDKSAVQLPLLEIKLELVGPDVLFSPELEEAGDMTSGIRDVMNCWIEDFLSIGKLLSRLDGATGEGEDYTADIQAHAEIKALVEVIKNHVIQNEVSCHKFRDTFMSFEYLWKCDLHASFNEFFEGLPSDIRDAQRLQEFDKKISEYTNIQESVSHLPNSANIGWLKIDAKPIKQALSTWVTKWVFLYTNYLSERVTSSITEFITFTGNVDTGLEKEVEEGDRETLMEVMGYIRDVRVRTREIDAMFEPVRQKVHLLKKYSVILPDFVAKTLEEGPLKWKAVKKKTLEVKERMNRLQNVEVDKIKKSVAEFEAKASEFRETFLQQAPFHFSRGLEQAYEQLDTYHLQVKAIEAEAAALNNLQELFDISMSDFKDIKDCRQDTLLLKGLWDMVGLVVFQVDDWKSTLFENIDVDFMVEEAKKLKKDILALNPRTRSWDVFLGLKDTVENMLKALPLVQDLRSPAMRDRHWKQLMRLTGKHYNMEETFSLSDLLELKLHEHVDDVGEIVVRAQHELQMEKSLIKIGETWKNMNFIFVPYKETDLQVLGATDTIVEALEENQVALQAMLAGRYVANFVDEVTLWEKRLATVEAVLTVWLEVQRRWCSLEAIFIGSEDIRAQLPEDTDRFEHVDGDWKNLMSVAYLTPEVVAACTMENRQERLEEMLAGLEKCEKALAEYLETKRRAFPRFYFVSSTDLLDILSKGSNPQAIQRHLSKCFDNVQKLEFDPDDPKVAIGMYSREGEYVPFAKPYSYDGSVEGWFSGLLEAMRSTLKSVLQDALQNYDEKSRHQWLFNYCAQIVLVASQVWWTTEVNQAFERLEDGAENALKDYNKKQQERLDQLTTLVQGELEKGDRTKIITLITIDVHARDVIAKLIQEKVENSMCFSWQSQLRYSWDEDRTTCIINIADAEFLYGYEFIGNCGRLVITPLTDRCYITLTQALRLMLGGAPAGPAGTGKTETTKDLGRALGIIVYVFNCSEQMDYRSMGNIFMGLAQSGSWGCFDEFNRIAIEVLSVVATQVKSILDAIRGRCTRFFFQDDEITLIPTCGMFITMNPGYAGRTELPENLKSFFRPVAMVVPDLELICEIMLASEGFIEAKALAKKFVTLYGLNRELLSKQDHYDWGLRAIKSVLVIAGSLKRTEPHISEDRILMRALRDFNLPKIVTEDVAIFLGLIGDLFPELNVPRKRDVKLEDVVRDVAVASGLQAEDIFLLKVVELSQLLEVRHSVFVIGPAGSGKSRVWKTLARAQTKRGQKTEYRILNPKAVTTNELYGYIHPKTRDWHDGLFSKIMRELANSPHVNDLKWIILDGDIDPEWIESLNTVMDDNKILTLASNERIPLNPTMRLLFEINDLRNATPATVSRAGILYINETDIGWKPFVDSWIDSRADFEKGQWTPLFDRYVTLSLEYVRKNFKYIISITEISMVQTLCHLLEGLTEGTISPTSDKEVFEHYFCFAAIWAFGGALACDKNIDYREQFSAWWRREFQVVKFPDAGSVYDYFVDSTTHKMTHWSTICQTPVLSVADSSLSSLIVPTIDTIRLSYLIDVLSKNRYPVMLVGSAGTGKTMVIQDKLRNLGEDTISATISLNHSTDAAQFQAALEQSIEKKAGRVFGPPENKRLIYFIDDMNMPSRDKYGTQSPLALLRQHLDYGMWFDRHKMTVKEIHSVQYLACMNPTAGSFTVNPRLQRHFATFACLMPNKDACQTIFSSILSAFMIGVGFDASMQKLVDKIVGASIDLHRQVTQQFLPTATKFHYQFNLRELANVFQGICLSKPVHFKTPLPFVRLWLHECNRVFSDRLIGESERRMFHDMLKDVCKRYFDDMEQASLHTEPLICGGFSPTGEDAYLLYEDLPKLRKLLEDRLVEYNESNATMDLVLFEAAMEHVCRITRILNFPHGNALLVGVGGSGKQSLSRLAAFICGHEVFQIAVTQSYGAAEFKADLMELYMKAGIKGRQIAFLLTDTQVVDEMFLVYINDLLSTGNIPDLFTSEEKDNIISSVRSEAKQSGLLDTKENCWDFFIEKVRRNLHVIFGVSPVGSRFRRWSRQFPAIINCTSIDWFHSWLQDALVSVAQQFLHEVDLGGDEVRESVAHHIAFVHQSVTEASIKYLESERRHNYTTPKTFLEMISLYKTLLSRKREEFAQLYERLEMGLVKLRETAETVAELQVKLREEQVVVDEKKLATEQLLVQVGKETAVQQEQLAIANAEEAKLKVEADGVAVIQAECARDLAEAEPALKAAEEALATLDKKSLTEMKSFTNPPKEVMDVMAAVLTLTQGNVKDLSWAAAKRMMAQVDRFLRDLITFDKDNIPATNVDLVEKYLDMPGFAPEHIKSKSAAAAGLCSWVVNIVLYWKVFQKVKPKRERLAEANAALQQSNEALQAMRSKLAEMDAKLKVLTDAFQEATDEKNRVIQEAERTKNRLVLAERLVNGLKDENERWGKDIQKVTERSSTLVGDVLLSSAFISYIGAFNGQFRKHLVEGVWLPDLAQRAIPLGDSTDPIAILTGDATVAAWRNDGLPSDRMSSESATIITTAQRWPLIIDPQLQGIKWIKNMEGRNNLQVVQVSQTKYLDTLENAIALGQPVIIENLGEGIDAVLDPLLSRSLIKKGRSYFIRLGDKEVNYDPRFRLYLQTRMANPHYPPEICAQATLVNFTVTENALEDQLLAMVVNNERPELEKQRDALLREQNEFKIRLKELEDNLLARLSNATGDILGDVELVENLETTKRTAAEIGEKVVLAKETEATINRAREVYRPVAVQGSLLYFILAQMPFVDHMYQYSLEAFVEVFNRAMMRATPDDDIKQRVSHLIDNITFTIFTFTSLGLFERHKLVFLSRIYFKMLQKSGELDLEQLDCLLRGTKEVGASNPVVDWLPDTVWQGIQALKRFEVFHNLPADIEGSSKRWREWFENEHPEEEKLPMEWKNLPGFQRLMIVRCLRPDRVVPASKKFIMEKMGVKYVNAVAYSLEKIFDDLPKNSPVFFILSPGADPTKDVEILARKRGFTRDNGKVLIYSLGQGQEPLAERALDTAYQQGGWVVLQNIHLTPKWLRTLEKKLETMAAGEGNANFHVFLTADPSPHIPVGILQRCMKMTNEPPSGLKANLLRAVSNFSDDTWEGSSKLVEYKAILFGLCFFHAVVVERRKFGPQGWNRAYPFNLGDLTACAAVLNNYLESTGKIPWDDLRYIFGEIMYGGHITDDWDRKLAMTYLRAYMRPELIDGTEFFPGFPSPPCLPVDKYLEFIEEKLPKENPVAYLMNANSEIGFMTDQADQMFKIILELEPRSASASGGMSMQDKVKTILDTILERVPEPFNLEEAMERMDDEDRNPYVNVFLQECQRMNILLAEVHSSLDELDLGLKGDLTISDRMEALMNALFDDRVPSTWGAVAWPSLRPLSSWVRDLLQRVRQLEEWLVDMQLPKAVWISGLFNPQAFLTAVMQTVARRQEWPLDQMVIVTEVSKRTLADIDAVSRDGAFIYGLNVEGSRFDAKGELERPGPKALNVPCPVILVKAVTRDMLETKDIYFCPVYKTQQRGPTYVFTATLRTKVPPATWILAGTALIMDVGQ